MRPCFAFKNAAAPDEATLSIYDEIGFWGVQASDFRTDLSAVKAKVINVEINSPGGDVFAGLAIYNMLKSSGKEIVVKVMGVAASAASLIAMAGDKIIMPKNTFMMIHNPWSFAMGNADELRDTADTLDKIGSSLLSTYVAKTGMAEDEMRVLLSTDTWLTADEALEKGFATEVVDDIKANAKYDMARADLPENVRAAIALSAAPAEPTQEEIDAEAARVSAEAAEIAAAVISEDPIAAQIHGVAVHAGLHDYADMWAVACSTVADVEERIAVAREITSICAFAKRPESAGQLIRDNQTLAQARQVLNAADVADDDATVIDTTPRNTHKQTTRQSAKPPVNTASLWASHNAQKVKKGS